MNIKFRVVKNGHADLGRYNSLAAAEHAVRRDAKNLLDFNKMPLVLYDKLSNSETEVFLYQSLDDLHFEVYAIVQVIIDE